MADICPTMRLTPIDDQPPELVKSVKTFSAEFRGAMVQRTMITAKKPKTWTRSRKLLMMGMDLAPQMLATKSTSTIATTSNVPCQFWASYSGLLSLIQPWMRVPVRKEPDAVPACQESVDSHPVM